MSSADDTDVAAWVEALLARGVTLVARGKRLTIAPKSAYAEMSDADHGVLRRHRAAIVAVVCDRYAGTARAEITTGTDSMKHPAPTPSAPKPAPCTWCYHHPCIGEQHPAYFALHPLAQARRDSERLTKEMWQQLGKLPRWI